MRIMKTLLSVAVLLGASLSLAVAAEPAIYFQENFRNYRETSPITATVANAQIGNDPIWSQRAEANFRMAESGLVFNDYLAAAIPDVRDYDVLFNFRFQTENERKFELRLRNGLAGKAGELIVTISADLVNVSSTGITPAVADEGRMASEIPNQQWRQCAITVRDGSVKVYVQDDKRVLEQVADASVSSLPLGGINFNGFKGSNFSVTDILVRSPAPLPDRNVTRLLPVLPNHNDYVSGDAHPTATVPAAEVFGATVRVGLENPGVKMALNWANGSSSEVAFSVTGAKGKYNENDQGKAKDKNVELPDAIIQVKGLGEKGKIDYHVRPMLKRYYTSYSYTDVYHDIVRDWDLLPKASEYPVKVECRRTDSGVDVYLNGRFAGALKGGVAKDLSFSLARSASLRDPVSTNEKPASAYLPLDIAALNRAKAFADATPSIEPSTTVVSDIPMRVASGQGSADIGLTREGQGNWALEVDEYLGRSAFDGLLTEVHFAVPSAPYTKAWVLCAVDPDPAKDPILTTRLTHYIEHGVGNNTIADTTIVLSRGDAAPGKGVTKVGTVSRKGINGQPIDVPLYLVEVPIRTGDIIDIIRSKPVLNFEFFGKPWENFEQIDNRSKPDPNSTSAVQIFGVTLEKSPVSLELVQSQPANVFHDDEKRETTAVVHALAPAKGKLAWEIRDVDGQQVGGGASDFSFASAGEKGVVNIPLDVQQLGWYALSISLHDAAGNTLMTHPARFALLGKNDRKASYESPYGIWWFDGVHNTPGDLAFAGPIMFKAGIRQVAWTSQSEAAMAQWSLTKDQLNMPFKFDDLKNPEAAKVKAEKTMNEQLAKYPHAREVAVFHESGPGNDLPVELFGRKPEMTEALVKREKRYADLFNLAGEFYREKYPQLKLVVGNNSAAQAVVAAIFRHGGKPEYMDYIGIESPSQVYIPEKLQEWALQGHHMASDTAEALTGKRIPATGCYEFTYRSERDMGEQQQAEWYARDMLISLANRFTRIGTGILFDTSNSYYNGLWGGSGIMQRSPYGYPKKSYVAYAVLTNVLDQVTFRKQIPTGSTTVYAIEFDRSDKRMVSALWASRGDAEFALQYEADTAVEVVDMYGRRNQLQTQGGKVTVKAGTAPAYVVADKAIASITLVGRSFPKDAARAALATVAAPLDRADAVVLVEDASLDTPVVAPLQLPVRKAGKFQVRLVNDETKGNAIELELDTTVNKDLSKYVTEYATIKLKEPVAINGNPEALGVWVKGDSNWGRVLYEIQDAQGEVWRSVGTGGWGCDVLDWPGNAAVNFDGWNFVALPLRDTTLFNDHSPGPVLEQWVSGGGNKRIDFPIKVTGLIVEMNRTPLDLVDFKTAKASIRLKDLGSVAP